MAALNRSIFRKILLSVHQPVLKFQHWSANFQPILDCFIPNFKLKYEDSENIEVDRVSTVVLSLHQIKRRAFFLGHPVYFPKHIIIKSTKIRKKSENTCKKKQMQYSERASNFLRPIGN